MTATGRVRQKASGRLTYPRRLLLLLLATALSLSAASYYVTITGLGGEPDYELRFQNWAHDIDTALRQRPGDARIETMVAPTRETVRGVFERIAKEAKRQDLLVVMLIGHGTFDGVDYKINLPGPDISGAEMAKLLDNVPATRQLVVNMTSASGASIDFLRKPNRVVITATKSGTEKNATVFARYWAESLRDPAADTDKNEAISALEAFHYAERKTANFYETQKRLATEHALLEDTGKGEGVKDPSPANGEGLLAAAFPLVRSDEAASAASDPAKKGLLAKKETLEQEIDRLKYQKAALPQDVYRERLTALLLELAKTQEELDK